MAGRMNRPAAILLTLTIGAAGAALAGCTAPHPAILSGDANSVEVSYGGDVASALPLARQHCAKYERLPRLSDAGLDVAIFDCVRR
jgi:hypothetical protein